MSTDQVFAALADRTRRDVIELIGSSGEASATQLARELPVSRQAINKHLASLAAAGLVADRRAGREVLYRLTPAPMSEAMGWMTAVGARMGRSPRGAEAAPELRTPYARLQAAVGQSTARWNARQAGFGSPSRANSPACSQNEQKASIARLVLPRVPLDVQEIRHSRCLDSQSSTNDLPQQCCAWRCSPTTSGAPGGQSDAHPISVIASGVSRVAGRGHDSPASAGSARRGKRIPGEYG